MQIAASVRTIALIAIIVVSAALYLAVTISPQPRTSAPPTVKITSVKNFSIVFDAYNDKMVIDLLTTLNPYIRQGDSFDLVSGNDDTPLNITTLDKWAYDLNSRYPNYKIYAHTTGVNNVATLLTNSSYKFTGIYYDYEPNFSNEPEFSWNFTETIDNFRNVTAMSNRSGLESMGYPTGRPILGLQQYGWNYGVLAKNSNGMIIQTQTYCSNLPRYKQATQRVKMQFYNSGMSKVPIFQITVGAGGRNAVAPVQAYQCSVILEEEGINQVYIWWADPDVASLVSYLKLLGR